MTKHNIEVSKEVWDEYVKLKGEINKMGGQEISDDHILTAMIGGFFDSLEYMKKAKMHEHDHGHHHHDNEGCCGGKGDDCCESGGDDCCGGKGKDNKCDCK